MPLFRDKRGRFFSLPDEVLERFAIQGETLGAEPSAAADAARPTHAPEPNAPSSASATVVIVVLPAQGANDSPPRPVERQNADG